MRCGNFCSLAVYNDYTELHDDANKVEEKATVGKPSYQVSYYVIGAIAEQRLS